MKTRLRLYFVIAGITCGLFTFISCAKHKGEASPPPPSAPSEPEKVQTDYSELWTSLVKDLKLSTFPSDFDEQVNAITSLPEYATLTQQIEEKAISSYQRTQCGQIVGMGDFSKPLRGFDFTTQKTVTAPGSVYYITFHPRKTDGSISQNTWVGLITKPDPVTKKLPFVLWAHESFNGFGADRVGYNSLINRLNSIQTKAITALAIHPGECLVDKEGRDFLCSTNDEKRESTYDFDVEGMLTFSDCVRSLNEQTHVSWLNSEKKPSGQIQPNPFYGTIESDPALGIKQMVMGYSYGGGTALLTAAKAGVYIKQLAEGKIPSSFHPHYFHGVGLVAPFGSLFTGSRTQNLAAVFADKKYGQPGREFYSFGFISRSLPKIAEPGDLSALPSLKLALAEREAIFVSPFLPYSMKSKFNPTAVETCNLSVFYSKQDWVSNYPSINRIVGERLMKDCKTSSVSFYDFTGVDPHNPWAGGKVVEFEQNGVVDPASPSLGQSLYPIENEWFDHLNK
jgi:hypothetical protein